ncbi:MAG: enoyl-CoA hydratase-related protein [Polyangiaceae bacterium]
MGRALDLMLSGRAVGAAEALSMGLVNRVVPRGTAREAAEAWAAELSELPQACMRNDRRSAYDQWSMSMEEAMSNELRLGLDSLAAGLDGATRFAERRRG